MLSTWSYSAWGYRLFWNSESLQPFSTFTPRLCAKTGGCDSPLLPLEHGPHPRILNPSVWMSDNVSDSRQGGTFLREKLDIESSVWQSGVWVSLENCEETWPQTVQTETLCSLQLCSSRLRDWLKMCSQRTELKILKERNPSSWSQGTVPPRYQFWHTSLLSLRLRRVKTPEQCISGKCSSCLYCVWSRVPEYVRIMNHKQKRESKLCSAMSPHKHSSAVLQSHFWEIPFPLTSVGQSNKSLLTPEIRFRACAGQNSRNKG